MKTLLFSYKGVFKDEKMHPGFKVGEVLFILTNTRPLQTPYVCIDALQVESEHFKAKGDKIFLTVAYNQNSAKFNEMAGGKLELTGEQLLALRAQFVLPANLEEYFFK